ncbi:MAG: hypothetical protein PHG23_02475 [Candidatus Pacebacteria bacterium]|nr:hypothetical protein [Candidatus Paceibacterota bacterium]
MLNKKNKIAILSITSIVSMFFATAANAVCPVCTVGVAAGLGLARWLRIDDTITGLWIGGFTVLLVMWTIAWFDKKNIKFWGRDILTTIVYFFFVLWPLRFLEVGGIGNQSHTIWGMDKLVFSILLGAAAFFGFEKWYRSMRAKRGKSLFRYQKVIWPIIPLIVLSVFFYFVTKYNLLCCNG